MSEDNIQYTVHDYDPLNKYIDERARIRRTRSVWGYTRSIALFLVALGKFLILAAYAYHLFKKPHTIDDLDQSNKNITQEDEEKIIDGQTIKYNSTTHWFTTAEIGQYSVTTRRKYAKTKDLLEQTQNYKESCYITVNNVKFEYEIESNTQLENLSSMNLTLNQAKSYRQYCRYSKK